MGELQESINVKSLERLKGGVLLLAGVKTDLDSKLIVFETADKRLKLINSYEAGLVSLQDLNSLW